MTIRVRRLRCSTFLAVAPLLTLSPFANAQECSALISQGIYDIQSSASDLSTAASFASWYCDQKFSSAESANEFGASLAFPFKGIPIKFGFDSNSQNFSMWNSNFCGQIRQDQSLQSRLRTHIQTINAGIVKAFNDCINADGLSVWLERTYNPRVFKFAARFTSPNPERIPYSMVRSFDPGENVRCKDRPIRVDRATFRTRCVRTDDAAVSMVVTADFDPRGGGTLSLPAIEKIVAVPAQRLDIRGAYTCHRFCPAGGEGSVAFIVGAETNFTFINEGRGQSRGFLAADGTLVAQDWEGGLQATIEAGGKEIHWKNQTIWRRVSLPSLGGKYTCHDNCPAGGEGREAAVIQGESDLVFINEGGDKSGGFFRTPETVVAEKWGNLGATIGASGTEIRWKNKTVWRRKPGA